MGEKLKTFKNSLTKAKFIAFFYNLLIIINKILGFVVEIYSSNVLSRIQSAK